MEWVDVAGPPGVGKSALCDYLWGPHDIVPADILPPPEFHDFNNEVTRLLNLVREHPSFVAAVRMNRRSMRKMAAVNAMPWGVTNGNATGWNDLEAYIQTGFVQRGLGFGWRLVDMGKPVEELWHFFRLMPVSLGVVFLEANESVLFERNKARERVKETAHENRAFMGPLMQPAIEFAREVLDARGVPVKRIATTGKIDAARDELVEFAGEQAKRLADTPPAHVPRYLQPGHPAAFGSGGQIPVLSPPVWW